MRLGRTTALVLAAAALVAVVGTVRFNDAEPQGAAPTTTVAPTTTTSTTVPPTTTTAPPPPPSG